MRKRNILLTYVDINQTSSVESIQTASFKLMGEGIEELTQTYNAETETKQYIHQASGTTDLKSYAPTISISQEAIEDDDAYTFFDEKIRRPRSVGKASETFIVNVEGTYEGKEVTGTTFPAELQRVSISIDDYGGSASDGLSIGYTLNYRGDSIWGTWNATEEKWTNTPYTGSTI